MSKTNKKTELELNYQAYKAMESELLKNYLNKVVVFHNGEFKDAYNDFEDALKIATAQYGEGNFAIKKVPSRAKSLGFMRYKVGIPS